MKIFRADDHTTEVRCSPDVRRWPHDGFTMAKMYSRILHEIEPSCVLPVFFWHVKDFDDVRDGDARKA